MAGPRGGGVQIRTQDPTRAPLLRWRIDPQAEETADVYQALGMGGLAIAGYLLLFLGRQGLLRLRGP